MEKSLSNRRRRVLLVAYACSPDRGSEPGIGWHWSKEMAKYFDVWVLCEKHEFENDIKKYFAYNGEIRGLQFCFISKSKLEHWLQKIRGFYYLGYNFWQRRAYRVADKLNKKLHFDIIHHITLGGYREPGYLWKLDAPFIWGPVGGAQNYPSQFLKSAGLSVGLKECMRSILNHIQLRFSPRVRKALNRASFLLASNSITKSDFERIHNVRSLLMTDVGIPYIENRLSDSKPNQGPLKLLWNGHLEHRKALDLLIKALSKLPDHIEYDLRILGRGPMQKRWRKLARQTGIENRCKWLGWMNYSDAIAQYMWPDMFVFTSLRDTSGTVIMEALSHGLPIICLDHNGASDIVTEDCGIKIPVTSPEEVISQIAKAIASLADNRRQLKKLSQGAKERAYDYLWSNRGKTLANIYESVLTGQIVRFK
jgi:glycosyltransferase involved in cell wall biosynthesis